MVTRGKFFLYDSIVPALDAGAYTLTTSIDLNAEVDQERQSTPIAENPTHFNITAPRFKLPPDQALMVFPPANSEGAYDATLPQIVLKRRTLPWDRKAEPDGKVIKEQIVQETTPWLALVVIAEGEGEIVHDRPWAECVTPGVTLTGASDSVTASFLKVPKSTVEKVFPTIDDLVLLTHVREVNIDDTELALGDDDGFLSVVIANRLPQYDTQACRSKSYMACLVNLEKQLDALPGRSPPRNFFEVADIYISDAIAAYAGAVGSGAAVPVSATFEPRMLDPSDNAAMSDAVRRGEVVFHEGRLIDRIGTTGDGVNILGRLDPEEFLAGDFRGLEADNAVARPTYRIAGTFGGFDFPIETIVAVEDIYRFPVLTSWRFTCTGRGSFAQLMNDLNVGLLGTKAEGGYQRQLPPCTQPATGVGPDGNPVTQLPLEIAETGHVGLAHVGRTGTAAQAWYRGPFSPHQLLRNPLADEAPFPVLAYISDHLRMMTPEGREDVSLAVAFETGRLLAMSQPSFVAAMMRWRDEQFGAARARANQRAVFSDKLQLLDRFVGSAEIAKILSALERGLIDRELEGLMIGGLEQFRSGAICDPRVIVDPALPVMALQDDFAAILSNGLGIDRAVVERIATAPGDMQTLFSLQSATVGVVASDEINLGAATEGVLFDTLDAGVFRLAEVAIGRAPVDAGVVGSTPEIEDIETFLAKQLGEIDR